MTPKPKLMQTSRNHDYILSNTLNEQYDSFLFSTVQLDCSGVNEPVRLE